MSEGGREVGERLEKVPGKVLGVGVRVIVRGSLSSDQQLADSSSFEFKNDLKSIFLNDEI